MNLQPRRAALSRLAALESSMSRSRPLIDLVNRCLLLALALGALPFTGSPYVTLTAQEPGYVAPGAVAALVAGRSADFPDSQMARKWLIGFRNVLQDSCPGDLDSRGAEQDAGVSLVEAPFNFTEYVTSATPQAEEGRSDGRVFMETFRCPVAPRLARTIDAIIFRNGPRRPSESTQREFVMMLTPAARAAAGFSPDGNRMLNAEQAQARDSLADMLDPYLRSRWQGEMDESTLRAAADDIGEILLFSGISEKYFGYLVEPTYDGGYEIRLFEIPMIQSSLREPGDNPFQASGDPLDEFAEAMWARMLDMIHDFGEMGRPGPDDSDAAQYAVMDDLVTMIREVVPPELSEVFSRSSTRAGPTYSKEDLAVWRPLATALARLDGSTCRVADDGRFDRLHKMMNVSLAYLRVADLPVSKPGDTTPYTINGPTALGSAVSWSFEVRELDLRSATRTPVGEACTQVYIPNLSGQPEIEEDRVPITVRPFNQRDPRYGETAQAAGEVARSRVETISFVTSPDVAEEILTSMQALQDHLEGRTPSVALEPEVAGDVWQPAFTPYSVAPALTNRAEVQSAIGSAGVGGGGTAVLWLEIGTDGAVLSVRTQTSSGETSVDAAAHGIAEGMRFTPAMNAGEPVTVWIQLPITVPPGGIPSR